MRFCIVGAGFSGAVIARHLAQQGHTVTLAEERPHIGGNCHTSRDPDTHVMLHHYGPHIFHTAHQHVWEYVQKFATFLPYINRVKATSSGHIYSLPINLFTINQFFGKTLRPDEAKEFLKEKSDSSIKNPQNFEEQALSMIGPELYQAFFRGYTLKQWGVDPTSLPASILKRLPVRFNYDDNYFNHPYQGIPKEGYTALIENILDHPNIHLHLNTTFEALTAAESYNHVFYTGPIDRYFNYCHGRLGYRTLDFERFDADGDYQGTAVMNYCDEDVPYTRISEHKHFAPWEAAHLKKTTCFREYSRLATPKDAPYYPIRLTTEMSRLKRYLNQAEKAEGVSFLGRLGTYRYLDMDRTIAEALSACTVIDQKLAQSSPIPSFFTDPHSA